MAASETTSPDDGFFQSRGLQVPFVGRERDVQVLRDIVSLAQKASITQLVTLTGIRGSGKSRLLRQTAASLHSFPGLRVALVQCRAGRDLAADLVAAHFSHLRHLGSVDEQLSQAEADWGPLEAVTRQFVRDALGEDSDLDMVSALKQLDGEYDRVRSRLLSRFLANLADNYGWCALIDDIDHADDTSLAFLDELALSIRNKKVALVLTARPGFLAESKHILDHAQEHTHWELGPLSFEESTEAILALLGRTELPDELVEDAFDKTEGNPKLLLQIARSYIENGVISDGSFDRDKLDAAQLPLTVEDAIDARISALSESERALLEKGAVFGNVFWASAVVSMTRMEQDPPDLADNLSFSQAEDLVAQQVASDIDALVERDYLLKLNVEDSTISGDVELVFKHNLEREQVVALTTSQDSERFHRWGAQWLETRQSEGVEEQLETLAGLYEAAGNRPVAGGFYLEAGNRAAATGEFERALSQYSNAHAMLPATDAAKRFELFHNRGDSFEKLGQIEQARAQFQCMYRLAWQYDTRAKGGAAANRMGRIDRRVGELDQARDWFNRALALFQMCADRRGIAATLDDMGQILVITGDWEGALVKFRESLQIRRELGDKRSVAASLVSIARAHRNSGRFREAMESLVEAQRIQRDIGDRYGLVRSFCVLADLQAQAGMIDQAIALLKDAEPMARYSGDRRGTVECKLRVAELLLWKNQLAEARSVAAEASALAARQNYLSGIAEASRLMACVLIQSGDLTSASEELRVGEEKLGDRNFATLRLRYNATQALIAAARGDFAEADRAMQHGLHSLRFKVNRYEEIRLLAEAVRIYHRAGRAQDANDKSNLLRTLRQPLISAVKQARW